MERRHRPSILKEWTDCVNAPSGSGSGGIAVARPGRPDADHPVEGVLAPWNRGRKFLRRAANYLLCGCVEFAVVSSLFVRGAVWE